MTAETFDRTKPLYRRFEMEDGSRAWFTINVDNTPGAQVNDWMVDMIETIIDREGYREAFEAAFEKHRKATVYAKIIAPYEVPEGCDAILRFARIEDYCGEKVAVGSILGDRRQRFEDGRHIRTTKIMKGPDENGIIRTRNTTYKLEMKATS